MWGTTGARDASSLDSRDRVVLSYAQFAAIVVGTLLLGATLSSKVMSATSDNHRSFGHGMTDLYETSELYGSVLQQDKRDYTLPRVAWLMSFPNSGTSFTLDLVSKASQTMVATNYGKEDQGFGGKYSAPIHFNHTDGPFWLGPEMNELPLPPKYVLTKTHCGGRCEDCGPYRYIETPHSFLVECLSGTRFESDLDGNPQYLPVTYDSRFVHRAVHIIRNPFDNAVSRFNLEYNRLRAAENGTDLDPASRESFRAFCEELNVKRAPYMQRSHFIDQQVLALIDNVPCYADFFRYVEWHNLAFIVTDDLLNLPTYLLHYDDYETRFNDTVSELLSFLELEKRGNPDDFISGKVYTDYYTMEEIAAIKAAMKELASPATWKSIERYFI